METLKTLAMMFKKPQYMNLSVVGSPTINNGVASNFSDNDYLNWSNSQEITSISDYELCVKFTAGSIGVKQGICGIAGGQAGAYITNTGILHIVALDFTNNKYRDINTNFTLSANTTYYLKCIFRNGNIYGAYSTDGISYTIVQGATATGGMGSITTLNDFKFGYNNQGSFDGSIDFNPNNSYIKLNGTKYLFQFTMPLTKAGNPTIVDGVVSGFSSSNYLNMSAYSGTINSLEFVVKIVTTPTTITNNALILQLLGVPINIYVKTNKQITLSYKDTDNTTRYLNSNSTINVEYYKFVLNNLGAFMYNSVNGSSWSLLNSYGLIPQQISISGGKIGYSTSTYNVYDGSLDIGNGNSYIVINGTKYIFTLP